MRMRTTTSVRATEVRPDRAAYTGRATQQLWSWAALQQPRLSQKSMLFVGLSANRLDSAAADSPLVERRYTGSLSRGLVLPALNAGAAATWPPAQPPTHRIASPALGGATDRANRPPRSRSSRGQAGQGVRRNTIAQSAGIASRVREGANHHQRKAAAFSNAEPIALAPARPSRAEPPRRPPPTGQPAKFAGS